MLSWFSEIPTSVETTHVVMFPVQAWDIQFNRPWWRCVLHSMGTATSCVTDIYYWHNLSHMTDLPKGSSSRRKWDEQMLEKEAPGHQIACAHAKICPRDNTWEWTWTIIWLLRCWHPHRSDAPTPTNTLLAVLTLTVPISEREETHSNNHNVFFWLYLWIDAGSKSQRSRLSWSFWVYAFRNQKMFFVT